MDAAPHQLRVQREGAVGGLGLALSIVAVPIVVPILAIRYLESRSPVLGLLGLGAITAIWIGVLFLLARVVVDLIHGAVPRAPAGGFLWLATVIVTMYSFAAPAEASNTHPQVGAGVTYVVRPGDTLWSIAQQQIGDPSKWPEIVRVNQRSEHGQQIANDPAQLTPGWRLVLPPSRNPEPVERPSSPARATKPADTDGSNTPPPTEPALVHHEPPPQLPLWSSSSIGALPLALAAKRRRDFLQQSRLELSEDEVDATIDILRGYNPSQLRALRHVIGDREAGLIVVPRISEYLETDTVSGGPIVAVAVWSNDDATLVAFARPGRSLPLGQNGAPLIDRFAVLLNERGQCRVTTSPESTMRALALRPSFDDVVVYLGPTRDLDEEVAERCVTIGDGPVGPGGSVEYEGREWRFAPPAPSPAAYGALTVFAPLRELSATPTVRVQLLRANVVVTGLLEPFAATLRRRCVEMTAYLAVHHHEPVTGDRLRTRVLGRGDDASLRTLSNTASAVRRSLGDDEIGPRLQPVSANGLYQLRDVGCDLVEFHQLVGAARELNAVGVAATLRRALELVQGEPLATALRGYEWFLAEGYLARLLRDGEWAALRLAAEARDNGDFELAFWAIEQGRLLDPYNETLESALHRVPRLREFGGDGTGRAQHEPIGAG